MRVRPTDRYAVSIWLPALNGVSHLWLWWDTPAPNPVMLLGGSFWLLCAVAALIQRMRTAAAGR